MCNTGAMASVRLFLKKAMRLQSPRIQCCLCGCSVMSAMFGMFMLSAGICLVLNYNVLDVGSSGLPSNLSDEERTKTVGIILICTGIVSMGISVLVSVLYFTACSSKRTPKSAVEPQQQEQHHPDSADPENGSKTIPAQPPSHPPSHPRPLHSNGRLSPAPSAFPPTRRGGSLTNLRRVPDPQPRSLVSKDGASHGRSHSHTPPSSSRSRRRRKKGRHGQGRYQNRLEPHPEEAGIEFQTGSESRRSSIKRPHVRVNHDTEPNEDVDLPMGSMASAGSSESSISHAAPIQVDSYKTPEDPTITHKLFPELKMKRTEQLADTPDLSESEADNDEDREEVDSGTLSRSTLDSVEMSENIPQARSVPKNGWVSP